MITFKRIIFLYAILCLSIHYWIATVTFVIHHNFLLHVVVATEGDRRYLGGYTAFCSAGLQGRTSYVVSRANSGSCPDQLCSLMT